MAYQFTPNLLTGNATIDSQHKELISAINSLLEACASGRGRDKITETSKFLVSYTKRHFGDEEKLQQQSGYPDYVNHKKYHETFIVTVNEIVAELERTGPTVALVARINSSVGAWLINHITREDVKVAAHIKSKG